MKNISEHVSYKEATFSQTATKNDIDNDPNSDQLANIELCSEKIFEPIRNWVGKSVKINSCFRSDALNKRIGGAKGSQHCANKGAAFDIDDTFGHKTNKEMFFYIVENLDFDQLIYEYGTDNNPDWVHFSYVDADSNRNQILRVSRINGRSKYVNLSESDLKKLK